MLPILTYVHTSPSCSHTQILMDTAAAENLEGERHSFRQNQPAMLEIQMAAQERLRQLADGGGNKRGGQQQALAEHFNVRGSERGVLIRR